MLVHETQVEKRVSAHSLDRFYCAVCLQKLNFLSECNPDGHWNK